MASMNLLLLLLLAGVVFAKVQRHTTENPPEEETEEPEIEDDNVETETEAIEAETEDIETTTEDPKLKKTKSTSTSVSINKNLEKKLETAISHLKQSIGFYGKAGMELFRNLPIVVNELTEDKKGIEMALSFAYRTLWALFGKQYAKLIVRKIVIPITGPFMKGLLAIANHKKTKLSSVTEPDDDIQLS